MWLRFLLISVCKWIATLVVMILAYGFLLPSWANGLWLAIPTWIAAFILAFLFAHWAFAYLLPGRRETLGLIGVWTVVFFTGYFAFSIFASDLGPRTVVSYEIITQWILECIAIAVAAWSVRRRKIHSVLGEGMTV